MASPCIDADLRAERRVAAIRVESHPQCIICGNKGELLYEGLGDRLFGAPGSWDFKRCPSPECGVIWLDPMPTPESIAVAYKNYYTHDASDAQQDQRLRRLYTIAGTAYIASRYGYKVTGLGVIERVLGVLLYLNPHRRAEVDFTILHLPARQNGRLLEVGCGSGEMLAGFKRLGWTVDGIDFDSEAVQRARARELNVSVGTLSEQRFADNTFDVVVASHVIEHIHNPDSMLRECHRILKPGGLHVLVTPNVQGWGHQRFGSNWRGLEPPRHLHMFGWSSLRTLITRNGFSVAKCIASSRGVHSHLASHSLERCGSVVSSTSSLIYQRIRAELMGWASWLRVQRNKELSEDLILFAVK